MVTHVEQNSVSKLTLSICIADPCKKSSVELSSTKVENKTIGDNLAYIMGIVQVHSQMNLVHAELKAPSTPKMVHCMLSINA